MKSDVVRKIGFTGSTAVGKILMKQAADTVKKVRRQAESCLSRGMLPHIYMHEYVIDLWLLGVQAAATQPTACCHI